MRTTTALLTLSFLVAAGCQEDDAAPMPDAADSDTDAQGTTGEGDSEDPEGSGGETDGAGTDGGETGEPTVWEFEDVFATPNLDDDDGDRRDFEQFEFDADDDVAAITFTADVMLGMHEGDAIRLELSGDTQAMRVWHQGVPAVGHSADADTYTFTPELGELAEGLSLGVEFGDYNAVGQLSVSHLDADGNVLASDDVVLHSSPLILNHHLQPAEEVWAVEVSASGYDNASMLADFSAALGDAFTVVPGSTYGMDVWIQDEFEWATSQGKDGQRLDIVIDSIRDRGLDDYAEDALVRPSRINATWGDPNLVTSYDSFGNLEASPPVEVDGVTYPFGRIYYGRLSNVGLNPILGDFLASQQLQAPFELDTTWLCVGHVDEYSSFLPDPDSPKGFKLLLADVPAGVAILESLPASYPIPMYGADHGYATVGDLLADEPLMQLNDDIQADYIAVIRQQFKDNLGLTDDDIIEVPSLWEMLAGCGAASLIPGMVNLQVAQLEGTTHVFVADPFFRSDTDQAGDPFIEAYTERMPAGLQLHFVDEWDVYHLGIGEVHCGTNVQRTPMDTWWTAAADLLGG